jgi:hypothetical protein
MLRAELTQLFEAVRKIISTSPLSEREKNDCLRNLRPVDEILAHVTSMQDVELQRSDDNGEVVLPQNLRVSLALRDCRSTVLNRCGAYRDSGLFELFRFCLVRVVRYRSGAVLVDQRIP